MDVQAGSIRSETPTSELPGIVSLKERPENLAALEKWWNLGGALAGEMPAPCTELAMWGEVYGAVLGIVTGCFSMPLACHTRRLQDDVVADSFPAFALQQYTTSKFFCTNAPTTP